MPRPRAEGPKRVKAKLHDGSVWYYYYDRKTGAKVGQERADVAAESAAKPGSFAALIDAYKATARFKSRKPRTQETYSGALTYLRRMMGNYQVSAITAGMVQMAKEDLQATPSKANQVLALLSILFKMAIKLGQITSNPAASPGRLPQPKRTEIWSREEEDRNVAAFRPTLKLAFMLLLYTLQRPSDMLAMTLLQVSEREGRLFIALRQQKTDTLVAVPVHRRLEPFLRERLAARVVERKRGDDGQMMERVSALLVPSPTGLQWTRRNFSRAWDHDQALANDALREQLTGDGWSKDRIDRELAARHRQRRDLRRTGIVRLAEAGATTPQIAAVSGHSIDYCQRIIDTYLPRRTEVAIGGIELWEKGEGSGSRVVRLADGLLSRAQPAEQWAPVSENELENRFPKPNERRKKAQ